MSVLETVKFFHNGRHYKVEIIEENGILRAQNYVLALNAIMGLNTWEKTSGKPLRSTDVSHAVIEAESSLRDNWRALTSAFGTVPR
jgi:hypothetical protein